MRRLLIIYLALCGILAGVVGSSNEAIAAGPCVGSKRVVCTTSPVPERFIATRSQVPSAQLAGFVSFMARTSHVMRANVPWFRVAIPNFYVLSAGAGEAGSGGTGNVTLNIEYPAGVCTPISFSGSTSAATIPNANWIWSDRIYGVPSNGAQFWTRIRGTGWTNLIVASTPGGANNPVGDAYQASNSGDVAPDTCQSVANSIPTLQFFPIAITGPTTNNAVIGFGDSIAMGYQESTEGPTGDVGVIFRSVGPYYGYANMAVAGSVTASFTANTVLRRNFLKYATIAINELGINDLPSLTPAQILTNYQGIYSLFTGAGLRAYQTTITPEATSTDNFVQLSNETTSGFNTNRVSLDTSIRAGLAQLSGVLETAYPLETSQNSGLVIVNGGAAATVTISIASPGVIAWTSHGLSANAPIVLTTTGALPTGLTAHTTYYVKTVTDANDFTVSATPGGAAINTTGSQSGTQTGTRGNSCPTLNVACDGVHPASAGSILVQNALQPTITTILQYPFLLKRDVDPSSANDNAPMWLNVAA